MVSGVVATVVLSAAISASQRTPAAERLGAWAKHQALEEESPFASLDWRAVGPKMAGGRVEAIAVPQGQPSTVYVGIGSGNVWKTTNNGLTWTPVFEKESSPSIGDIAVAPANPDIVWVGTGETEPRHSGYSYAGTGVFKSNDGGRTWTNMGLHESHHIGKIVIDPRDPDTVYVAAIGAFWSAGGERGVFKTSDGGRTWRKSLDTGDRTGVVDLVADPADSRILYAAAWQTVTGPESAIYKSTDAGRTWRRLSNGLPAGPLGRIGLDVAPSNPRIVYAFIDNQAPYTGPPSARNRRVVGAEVYRSDDRGDTWRRINKDDLYGVFTIYGWKFCDVRVAPSDPEQLYILGNAGYRSDDGGRTFRPFGEQVLRLHDTEGKVLHLDHHEIWLDPQQPGRVLLGNDGGLFASHDRGQTWLHLNNIPAVEFYAISVDNDTPYRIFGGTQDNAALYGPSDVRLADTTPDLWRHVYLDQWTGGDSFTTLLDPTDQRFVYYEHQHGALRRMDLTGPTVQTGGRAVNNIAPRALAGEEPWRFGWHMPFLISPHNATTLYAGANKLLKSLDRGSRWRAISPDLSDPGGGERAVVPFGVISALDESPIEPGILYAGTEAGSLWLTRDGGATWGKVGAGLPRKWISRVVPSRYDPASVYVSLTGFREDDFSSYLFVSRDFGKSWSSISGNLPAESINVVREDPKNPQVLYVGTDLGVYASLDRGGRWISLSATLPTTPVLDLVIHERDDEIAIGTHGRGAWVLDARPIQQWPSGRRNGLYLFEPRTVFVRPTNDVEPTRPPAESSLLYYLQDAQPIVLTLRDAAKRVVLEVTQDGRDGLNLFRWDGRIDDRSSPGGGWQGPPVRRLATPGTYTLELRAGPHTVAARLQVEWYPRRL
jgi:photosystem II stability/assembly factor-like uncharacterized protein